MVNLQYWHGDKYLGDDTEIAEYINTEQWVCPYCGRSPKYIYGAEDIQTGEEYPIGCDRCVDVFEEEEDGYSAEYAREEAELDHADWEYQARIEEEALR